MKRIITILLIAAIMLGISACGNSGEEIKTTKSTTTPAEEITFSSEETTVTEATEESSTYIPKFTYDGEPISAEEYRNPFVNLAFDAPSYQRVNMGLTELFNRSQSLFLSFTGGYEDKSSDLKAADVWDVIGEDILYTLKHDFYGSSGYELIMDETEEMTINGIECVRFEGRLRVSFKDSEGHDKYAVGYTFVIDDMPCAMFGVVVEKEQLETHVNEVKNNIDEMAKTIRKKS